MAIIKGAPGPDTLTGTSAADTIYGGNGNDRLYGATGNDLLYGGEGTDKAYGGDGIDRIWGGNANDVLIGDGGTDTLYGDQGNDSLYGGTGSDTLYGGDGNDWLYGGSAKGDVDRLYGGGGADHIISTGAGPHHIWDGTGSDVIEVPSVKADRFGDWIHVGKGQPNDVDVIKGVTYEFEKTFGEYASSVYLVDDAGAQVSKVTAAYGNFGGDAGSIDAELKLAFYGGGSAVYRILDLGTEAWARATVVEMISTLA